MLAKKNPVRKTLLLIEDKSITWKNPKEENKIIVILQVHFQMMYQSCKNTTTEIWKERY